MIWENKIIYGDAIQILKKMPDEFVDCIITSPPYWQLRRYTDSQEEIGKEEHPKEYINKIVEICVECMRVLKSTGNFFLNLGDSYATHKAGKDTEIRISKEKRLESLVTRNAPKKSLKSNWFQEKQKLLIPHRIAISLQDKGFIIRDDNVWVKKLTIFPDKESIGSTMPFPIKDRFSSSTEYIFHIVKSKRYYFNLESVKLPTKKSTIERAKYPLSSSFKRQVKNNPYLHHKGMDEYNKRLADKIIVDKANPTNAIMFKRKNELKKQFEEHFATFPSSLASLFIEVGCPKEGIVLDPFVGSGTTCLVAKKLKRKYIGIDISEKYCKIARKRLDNRLGCKEGDLRKI